tara:strand:+ start:614 stop:1294 length:681 start_codon:yes stop_codon:yes gene_type:complete
MRNIYTWDSENSVLSVNQTDSKALSDIERILKLGKPVSVVDSFIKLHLEANEPNQLIVDKWYEQHLIVESSDPDEVRFTRTFTDENGVEQSEELPNKYEVALTERTAIETDNDWLKGYRGLAATQRPKFLVDVEQFKLDNTALFKSYLKAIGIMISGVGVSLNESNQHGLADISVMIDKATSLGQQVFPINMALETIDGVKVISAQDQQSFDYVFLTFGLARQSFF